MTSIEILDLPMSDNDADAPTVREYFKALLARMWRVRDGFSGKRPFGNSGWYHDLYMPLLKAGLVKGEVDEEGYIQDIDGKAADILIAEAIEAL